MTKPATPLDLDQFAGHTPGPWAVGCDFLPQDERLINAAPALLSECKRLMAERQELVEALQLARESIAHAQKYLHFQTDTNDKIDALLARIEASK